MKGQKKEILDIEGGKMNKQEADIEAKKIFQETSKKIDEIIAQAKKDGIWQMGLDSNRELFEELDRETKKKLKTLASMIDE